MRLLLILLLLWPSLAWGTDYTVCSSGCDETTIGAVFSGNDLAPGETIEVQADAVGGTATFTDKVTWGTDDLGSAGGGYVTLQGRAGDTIIIDVTEEVHDGAGLVWDDDNTEWTDEGGNVWSFPTSGVLVCCGDDTATPGRLFLDGTEYPRSDAAGNVDSTERCYYDTGTDKLYVYSVGNPVNGGAAYSSIQGSMESDAINMADITYGKIKNITIKGGYNAGVRIARTTYSIIEDCTIGDKSMNGIEIIGTGAGDASYNEIKNCTIDSNYRFNVDWGQAITDGIVIADYSHYNKIYGNTFTDWNHTTITMNADNAAANGITYNEVYNNEMSAPSTSYCRPFGLSGVADVGGDSLLHHNKVYNNAMHDFTIKIQFGGEYNEFYYNMVYDFDTDSTVPEMEEANRAFEFNWVVGTSKCRYNKVYNNTFYNINEAGFRIGAASVEVSGNLIRNNLFMNCGVVGSKNGAGVAIHIEDDADVGSNTYENNHVYKAGVTNTISYRGDGAISVATFNSKVADTVANNQGTSTLDPLLANPAAGLFKLQSTSPCIDTGTDVSLTTDHDGNPVGSSPDIGAYEYSSVSLRGCSIE